MSYKGSGKNKKKYFFIVFCFVVLNVLLVCFRSSHCALYLQGAEENHDSSKLGEASCVTRFIRMLLSLVSFGLPLLFLIFICLLILSHVRAIGLRPVFLKKFAGEY